MHHCHAQINEFDLRACISATASGVVHKVLKRLVAPRSMGLWEWLGQTPRLVQVPKLPYYYYIEPQNGF
jgi:hypothetical protein